MSARKFELLETDDLAGISDSRVAMLRASVGGDTYEKISLDMGLPIGTVKSNLNRTWKTVLSRRAPVAEPAT